MGSRCLLFLLSVIACGSSQGESRQNVIFRQKSADLRSESSAGEATAEQVKADLEHHKGMKAPFSLATSFNKTALRTADREPMGGFLWGLLFSVRCHCVENSQKRSGMTW